MEINTSAARLLNIIKEGQKIPKTENCLIAWSKILDAQNDIPLLFKRLGTVMALPSQIKEVVLNIEGISDTKPYLNWLIPINNAFTKQNLSSQWASFLQNIDGHTVNYLTMTADMISIKNPEVTIPKDKLEELKNDFLNIKKEIDNSELDSSLKTFMLKRIKEILMALDEYKFNGLPPLIDALNISIGQIVTNKELVSKSTGNKIAEKFWNLIVNTSVVITLYTGSPQITNDIKKIVPFIELKNVQQNNSDNNKDAEEDIIDVEQIDIKDKTVVV